MHRAIYFSTSVELFSDKQLIEILSSARSSNEENGITGMLLYAQGNFMQLLEGPKDAIDKTMERIRLDKRHRDIRVVFNGSTNERLFSDWRMGFKALDPEELIEIQGFELNLSSNNGEHILFQEDIFIRMMKKFYESNMGMTL